MDKAQNQSLKKKVFSGLFWTFGERIIAQLISLIVSLVLARLLLPSDYGVVSLVLVFISFADVFVSSGFGNALVQKKDADNLDFSSVFFINVGFSIVLYIVIFLFAPLIADFYQMPLIKPVIRVFALRIIVAAVNTIQRAYVSRHMLFKRFFWATLFGTIISGIVGIMMARNGYGVWALVAQYLTNSCIDTVVLWFTVKWRPELRFSWKRARVLLSFGWKLLVSALIDTGYNELRSLIIGKLYTAEDLAFYDRGDKFPKLVVVNVNSSISGVLLPAMSKSQDNRENVKKMTRRAIQVSSYVIWPLLIGLAAIATPLTRLLLTEKWLPCVPYLRIFCLTYGFWPIHTSNLQAINAMGRSDLFLKLEIIKKTAGIVALLSTLWIGPLAMAESLFVLGILSTFINAFPNRKLLNYSYLEQIKDILPSLLTSLLMAVCIYPIQWFSFSDLITVVLQITVGFAVYMLLSIITKNSSLQYLLKLLPKAGKSQKE